MELPVIVELEYPITRGDEVIKRIVFDRRPTGADVGDLGANPKTKEMYPAMASLAGIAPSVFLDMDAKDVFAVGEAFNAFLV